MLLEVLKKHIYDHGLYCLPLEGTCNGFCTCKKKECTSRGKHPTRKFFWKFSSRKDKEKIEQWFNHCPNPHNIGVLTGRRSCLNNKYLVVIDIDYPCPELVDKLPKTFSYKTGKPDGIHLWFWSDKRVSNSVGLLAPRVDIRGENGYVVVPPSRHETGNIYSVLNSEQIADLPSWVVELLESNRTASKKDRSSLVKTVKKQSVVDVNAENWTVLTVKQIEEKLSSGQLIPVGQRNTVIFKVLAQRKISGKITSPDQILDSATEIASCVADPDSYSEQELIATVKSVVKIPCYKKDLSKFNENYVKFIKNTFHTQKNLDVESYTTQLDSFDKEFFSLLETQQDKQEFVLLKDLMELRKLWLEKVKNIQHFSKYGTNSFAEKLTEVGFSKRRTSKNCFWNVNPIKIREQLSLSTMNTQTPSKNVFKGTPVEFYILPSVTTLFVTDFFKEEIAGGAELTTQAIIDSCPENTAKIHSVSLTPKMIKNLSTRKEKPLLVFCNFSLVDADIIKHLTDTKSLDYVIVEYDLKFCAYRSQQLHFLQTQGISCDCKNTDHGRLMSEFYSSAKHVFWMAEKQIDLYEKNLGIELRSKSTVLSSCFSDEQLDLLRDCERKSVKETNKLAVLGSGSWIKGIKESMAWCKLHNKQFEAIPAMDYNSFIRKLAGFTGLVFKPLDFDTCPRLVIEAKLLGLQLYLNDNVLHKDEAWFKDSTVDELQNYLRKNKQEKFWELLHNGFHHKLKL